MCITNHTKFKGEIENYLRNGQDCFDSKIDRTFYSLKIKTWLSRTNIIKKDGYHASHLLFVAVIWIGYSYSNCKKWSVML